MKNLKYIFLFLLLFTNYSLVYSQSDKNDTLSRYSYDQLENKFYDYKDNNKIFLSKQIAKYYLQKAKSEKNKKYLAEGYVFNQYNQDLPIALRYIDSLEAISKNLQDDRYPARIFLLRGMSYNNSDNLKLALENFLKGLQSAKKNKNIRQITIAELQIAYLNGYIGKHQDALKILEHYYNNPTSLTREDIEHIQINLADVYLDVNESEMALKLIKKGLDYTLKNKEEVRYNRYLSLLGNYYLKKKQYGLAIPVLEKCKKYFLRNSVDLSSSYSMLYLADSYDHLKNREKAEENYIKIDSIAQNTNNTFPELRDVYSYLIDYYKEKNNKEKQLYYIDKFLKVDNILDSQFKYIARELPRKYDTPKLLTEKEKIISDLNNRKYLSYLTISVLICFLIVLMMLLLKVKKAERKYREIAKNLLRSVNEINMPVPSENKIHTDHQPINESSDIDAEYNQEEETKDEIIFKEIEKSKVPDVIAEKIIAELNLFEKNNLYLKKGITLSSLAKNFKTNSAYLSEVINTYKNKNFNGYLNDLRIDYAIKQLPVDRKLRSLKIAFIAEELGYNNEQAFAKAFKKETGTTVSTYIQEINGSNVNGSNSDV